MSTHPILPFKPRVLDSAVEDLVGRLKSTRLPDAETVETWDQGVPLSYQRELIDYWSTDYDFSRLERRLGAVENFITNIDGLDIHFIHKRSRHSQATPLLITHGWPGSVLEYLDIIDA